MNVNVCARVYIQEHVIANPTVSFGSRLKTRGALKQGQVISALSLPPLLLPSLPPFLHTHPTRHAQSPPPPAVLEHACEFQHVYNSIARLDVQSRAHTHTHIHTLTRTHTHMLTKQTHTHAYAHTHTHTHTLTHRRWMICGFFAPLQTTAHL